MARRRFPRPVYWLAGGALAVLGAVIANGLASQVPLDQRYPFWIAGTAVIFAGLYLVSQGTRHRAGEAGEAKPVDPDEARRDPITARLRGED